VYTHPSTTAKALWCCLHGAVAAGLIAFLSVATHTPYLFPALGGSIFTIFWAPRSPAASPRNVILGHFISACVGWLSLQAFQYDPPGGTLVFGSLHQVAAAGCAMGVASALMVWFHAPHGPAGATALIVATGLMPRLSHLPIIMVGAFAVSGLAWCALRMRGEPYPVWAAHHAREEAS
jgi:CBS domain-containing membrane protein